MNNYTNRETNTRTKVKDYEARAFVGSRIAQLREEQGMSVERLANITELTPSNIARIEQGKYDVGIDVLSAIAKALGSRLTIEMIG